MAKRKKKLIIKESKNLETNLIPRSEDLVICDIIRMQNRHWEISDGTKAELDKWYLSKRGSLIIVDELIKDGSIKARSHFTGNLIEIPPNQVLYFTPGEDPGTPCGTMLVQGNGDSGINNNVKEITKHNNVYSRYPHVVPDSIYKVKNITSKKEELFVRGKKKTIIKGQVRCKILCEICKAERDIKVQDAFQVKLCLECKNNKRKKNLKKFLDKKKESK